ncbi:MAG: mechanosensitive ion channel family protein [Balneolaceae bacterium]|nr:MAG: mechanosensitive ion channel family protein [Balneolaceae bacterium]
MEVITDLFSNILNISDAAATRVVYSVSIVILLVLLRFIILFVAFRNTSDPQIRFKWRRTTTYVATLFGFLLIGREWFEGMQSVATFLGLLSAGLAIALRELISNFAGWVFILWRQPFHLGDRIQIGDQHGDVIDKRVLMFSLIEIGNWVDADQSTGRVLHIPNSHIFTQVLANYTSEFRFIWHEIPVHITFGSNADKARHILQEIAEKHSAGCAEEAGQQLQRASDSILIRFNVLTPTVYLSVRENGVRLTVRYLTDPRRRRGTEQAIWEDTLKAFRNDPEIEFAYQTIRIYDHDKEGKKARRKQEDE